MTVVCWPCPRDLHELRSYVGWAPCQGHFISGFADIVCRIHQLTTKGQPIKWKDIQSLFEETRVLCAQFKFLRIRDIVSVSFIEALASQVISRLLCLKEILLLHI